MAGCLVERLVVSQQHHGGRILGRMRRKMAVPVVAAGTGRDTDSNTGGSSSSGGSGGGGGSAGGGGSGNGTFPCTRRSQHSRGPSVWRTASKKHHVKKKHASSVVGSQSLMAVESEASATYEEGVDGLVSRWHNENLHGVQACDVGVDYMNMASTTRAVVLAGGEQNNPLTKYRAMPAVPIGCCMLLIDVPINNCLSAGINKMYVMTQFQSHGLHSHIAASYPPQGFGSRDGGWVDVLAAQQTISGKEWYKGSADAIRRNLGELKDESRGVDPATDYVVLSGSAMYNMDISKVVGYHRIKNADITICSHFVNVDSASSKGLISADEVGRVTGFYEKPDKSALEYALGRNSEDVLVNMGVYVFKRDTLIDLLEPSDGERMDHIGHHVIPAAIAKGLNVFTYEHEGYWRDVSTLKDYYEANIALASADAPIKFFEVDGAVSVRGKMLPPARLQGSVHVDESILGDGCTLVDCTISKSIIGENILVGSGSFVEESLVLGSPMWTSETSRDEAKEKGDYIFGIGRNTHLKGCVVDENVYIGDNCVITNAGGISEADHSPMYMIEDGIVVILKNAVIPDGTII